MLKIFKTYEEIGLAYYAKDDDSTKKFTHPNKEEISVKVDESETKWKNPLRESSNWIKNEILDVQGMLGLLEGRETLMKEQLAAEKKLKPQQEELKNLLEGKKTYLSFYKTQLNKEDKIIKINEIV